MQLILRRRERVHYSQFPRRTECNYLWIRRVIPLSMNHWERSYAGGLGNVVAAS
jgi:hypothetical protein